MKWKQSNKKKKENSQMKYGFPLARILTESNRNALIQKKYNHYTENNQQTIHISTAVKEAMK